MTMTTRQRGIDRRAGENCVPAIGNCSAPDQETTVGEAEIGISGGRWI